MKIIICQTTPILIYYFFISVFPNLANEEAGIAQVSNISQLPGTDGLTSPPKDAVMNTSSF